jgi:Cu(I)/Ag(I) efflux system membrane protein CusA/SilA
LISGLKQLSLNNVEYIIRGLGYVKSLNDLEISVVAVRNNVPVRIKDVAHVNFGPATRRGGLDKAGSEAVGAVVVARYGSNPMEVINNVKEKIKEIEAGLPQKTLPDGTVSKVTVVPFYDRTGLIKETIGTLQSALSHEILISIIVIIVLVMNLRASLDCRRVIANRCFNDVYPDEAIRSGSQYCGIIRNCNCYRCNGGYWYCRCGEYSPAS